MHHDCGFSQVVRCRSGSNFVCGLGAALVRVFTAVRPMATEAELEARMETLAETTVSKMYKQFQDLEGSTTAEPSIQGVSIASATKSWEWDVAKFQPKTPLRELSEFIAQRISSLDDELMIQTKQRLRTTNYLETGYKLNLL